MSLEIRVLDLGDVELDTSFLVLGHKPGVPARIPTFGYLILGGSDPVLVDTGYSHPDIMGRLGMKGFFSPEQALHNQLGQHGVKVGDVRYVLHTHLHIDHAGQDDQFTLHTAVGLNRRELEFAASGLMGEQYPAEYIKHMIDRLHTPGAMRLFDFDGSYPIEIMPGLAVEAANAHTEGSMNVLVETSEGLATILGDVVYDVNDKLIRRVHQVGEFEPEVTGNHATTIRAEKIAVKRVVEKSRFICMGHDRPAVLDQGQVIGRLSVNVPGPLVEEVPRQAWAPV